MTDPGLLAGCYIRASGPVRPGRLCWAPVSYVEDHYFEASVAQQAPSDDWATTFRVSEYAPDATPPLHPPVKFLDLRADDRLRLARFKKRPVLVVSSETTPWKDTEKKHHRRPTRLVVPLYTADRYGSKFVGRVRRFSYNTHFWLPENAERGGKPSRETILRFDSIETVHERWLEPVDWSVSDEALSYVRAWLDYFLDGRHNRISKDLTILYAP